MYSQFINTIFNLLLKVNNIFYMLIMIASQENDSFRVNINNHIGAIYSLDIIFDFLSKTYIPRVVFKSVYLLGKKMYVFINILELLEFKES